MSSFTRTRCESVSGASLSRVLAVFVSRIRLTIAEFAVRRVFIHGGPVGWKGKAIVLPARSFEGKTTLVAELVKLGASYLSDEYAVVDETGFVHPFAKPLSIRASEGSLLQTDIPCYCREIPRLALAGRYCKRGKAWREADTEVEFDCDSSILHLLT